MTRRLSRLAMAVALVTVADGALAQQVSPPSAKDSVQFLAVGDTGTGDRAQYRSGGADGQGTCRVPFTFAIMMGDNMYGTERTQDYEKKFEIPYKPLLDAKVEFYASLGNHDDPNQRLYKPFNMNGERYYTFKKGNVRVLRPRQQLLRPGPGRLAGEGADRLDLGLEDLLLPPPAVLLGGRHGSEMDLRAQLEPLFLKHGVQVVFAGHEHFYERLKPQKGIHYFVNGGGAKLRSGDITKTSMTAVGFDADRSYMLVEIAGDVLTFQTLTRTGKRVDSGSIRRPTPPSPRRHRRRRQSNDGRAA